MAYNNYFGGYPASYQQYQAPNYQIATQPQPMQIQNGGIGAGGVLLSGRSR